jgi:hypothetical protein
MDYIDVEWFTVWNRDLASKSKKDLTITGPAVTSDLASSSLESAGNTANPDEDDDEESGILYKYAANQDEAGESLSRRIGLAQGLIDFARYFKALRPLLQRMFSRKVSQYATARSARPSKLNAMITLFASSTRPVKE